MFSMNLQGKNYHSIRSTKIFSSGIELKTTIVKTLFISVLTLMYNTSDVQAESKFTWNGFGTLGFAYVDNEEAIDHGGLRYHSYTEGLDGDPDTKFALQGEWQIYGKLTSTAQFVSRAADDFEPEIGWAYLTYHLNENSQLRVGKIRRPFYQFSDYIDLGYAYNWVRPPTIIYHEFGPLYSAINSIDYYFQKTHSQYTFSGELYYGWGVNDVEPFRQGSTYQEDTAYGGALNLEGEYFSFRLGYHRSYFDLINHQLSNVSTTLEQIGYPTLASDVAIENEQLDFLAIGGTLGFNGWSLSGEYSSGKPKDTIWGDVKSWYLNLQKTMGQSTFSYTYGRQYWTKNYQILNQILEESNNLSASTDPQSQYLSSVLDFIGNGLIDQYVDKTYAVRRSNVFGFRHELNGSTALKIEYERIKNTDVNTSSNIYSISLDYIF